MMIDPRVVGIKRTSSRGRLARRVALSLLGFAALGTVFTVRDIQHSASREMVSQSTMTAPNDRPVWSDKVMVVTAADRIGS